MFKAQLTTALCAAAQHRVLDHASALLMEVLLWSQILLELDMQGGVVQPVKVVISWIAYLQQLAT